MRPAEKASPLWQAICEALPVFRPSDQQIVEVVRPWVNSGNRRRGQLEGRLTDGGIVFELCIDISAPPHSKRLREGLDTEPTKREICKTYWRCVQSRLKMLADDLAEPKIESLKRLVDLLRDIEARGQEREYVGLANEILWESVPVPRLSTVAHRKWYDLDATDIEMLCEETKELTKRLTLWLSTARRIYPDGEKRPFLPMPRRQSVEKALEVLREEQKEMEYHLERLRLAQRGARPRRGGHIERILGAECCEAWYGNRKARGRLSWPAEKALLRRLAGLFQTAGYSLTYDVPVMVQNLCKALPVVAHRSVDWQSIRKLLTKEPVKLPASGDIRLFI